MSAHFFVVALNEYGEPRTLYHENAAPGMEPDESSWGADDDYWPLPKDAGRLMTFTGFLQSAEEAHASNCGCDASESGNDDSDDGEPGRCQWPNEEEFAWVLSAHQWRPSTAADLIRAGLIAPGAADDATGASR